MSAFELVVVDINPEDAGAVVYEAGEIFGGLAGCVDRDDLSGDGVLVFEPGVPDFVSFDLEVSGEGVAELEGGEFFFFDEEEDVFALAGGVVEGDFLDEEILWAYFELALNPRDFVGEVLGGVGAGGERGGGLWGRHDSLLGRYIWGAVIFGVVIFCSGRCVGGLGG